MKLMKVECTGWRYCMSCPIIVDIPGCFEMQNNKQMFKGSYSAGLSYHFRLGGSKGNSRFASLCINCGKCEQHCPQDIPIREKLKGVQKEFEIVFTRPYAWLIRKVMSRMGRKHISG